MKYLAETPKTPADRLRRAIAVILDDAFIYQGGGEYALTNLPDMDGLVDRLATRVEQIELERVQAFLDERVRRNDQLSAGALAAAFAKAHENT